MSKESHSVATECRGESLMRLVDQIPAIADRIEAVGFSSGVRDDARKLSRALEEFWEDRIVDEVADLLMYIAESGLSFTSRARYRRRPPLQSADAAKGLRTYARLLRPNDSADDTESEGVSGPNKEPSRKICANTLDKILADDSLAKDVKKLAQAIYDHHGSKISDRALAREITKEHSTNNCPRAITLCQKLNNALKAVRVEQR